MANKRVILIILDGWGYAPSWGGNAVESAETPVMDNLWRKFPHTILKAAEEAVGLPIHEPGNSEVGHLNLGSGQIVRQNLPGITATIDDKSFFNNQILLEAIDHAKKNSSNVHLLGLVSDGGVHSHISHLFALLSLLKAQNFERVFIHMITDGRDTDPMKGLSFLEQLEDRLKEIKLGKIETIMGRYYAMDRDNRWDRIQKAYDALTLGIGGQFEAPEQVISSSYRGGKTDEFILPAIATKKEDYLPVNDNDSIIFFNFRADRTKEITKAFLEEKFRGFPRKKYLKNLYFASFAFFENYGQQLPVNMVFKQNLISNPLAKILSENNLTQFHIAETEKYAHVTYFFNGGVEKPFNKEDRILIPSPKIASYDLKPEMSAGKIKETLISKFSNYDFSVLNFANPDMVGHTGNLKATVKACEFVDLCLGEIVKVTVEKAYNVIVTADHGHAEQMINPNTSEPQTEHTINPVPFILVSNDPILQNPLRGSNDLKLSDVAPTILKIMGLPVPQEMTGKSLIE